MTKRTLAEAKEERRKRWKAIEARKVPGEVAFFGWLSLAAATASSILYLIHPSPHLAISFAASFICFVAACVVTIRLRP